jgi:hypothetical protein
MAINLAGARAKYGIYERKAASPMGCEWRRNSWPTSRVSRISAFPVSDVDKSTRFYTEIVGCKFLSALPDKSITFLDADCHRRLPCVQRERQPSLVAGLKTHQVHCFPGANGGQ